MRKIIFLALVAPSLSRAFQFPFDISSLWWSNLEPQPLPSPDVVPPRSPRVAIVGAGAGGSSAAFWIAKAKERYRFDIDIDIFERNDYVGGRSTTVHPHNNTAYEPVELGASIIVDSNKNLLRAANEFNLSLYGFDDEDGDMAIWDGERISHAKVIAPEPSVSWLPSWLQKLGFLKSEDYSSPRRMQELIQAMTDKFVSLYEPSVRTWSSIEELNNVLNWTELVSQSGAEYFQSHGISQKFTNEYIGARTRVHYAQNIHSIHGLGAIFSLAASSGGGGIRGGNRQIFEQFVEQSGAQVFLKTEVVGIERHSDHTWVVVTEEGRRDYDAVIIAAPYQSSHISLPADLSTLIPPQPYVHLHTTLLTTTAATPNPAYFGYKPVSKVATNVATTFDGASREGRASEFNFVSYQGQAKFSNETNDGQETGDWVVKIYSMDRLSDEWLATMFQNQVGWVHCKEWDAYPVLPPTTKFPPIRLDDGLFYVNAFEPFISSMETETVASGNIVDLLLREKFNASICEGGWWEC